MKTNNKSFTLIELLVVIVIIGILAGVIMISTSSSIDKANIAKSKVFADSVRNDLLLNLTSEWTFDGPTNIGLAATNNDVKDTWGSNNGTVYGNPQIKGGSDCVSGKCMSFDGDGDYVVFPHPAVGASPVLFTVSGWIKPKNSNSFFLTPQSAGMDQFLRFDINQVGVNLCQSADTNGRSHFSPAGTTPLNHWTQFFIVVDDAKNNVKIYINGDLKLNATDLQPMANWDYNWILGQRGDNTYYYQGLMDTLQVYNITLSSTHIKKEYIAGIESLYSKGIISRDEFEKRLADL